MNTILELREKRSKLWNNAKDFLDSFYNVKEKSDLKT